MKWAPNHVPHELEIAIGHIILEQGRGRIVANNQEGLSYQHWTQYVQQSNNCANLWKSMLSNKLGQPPKVQCNCSYYMLTFNMFTSQFVQDRKLQNMLTFHKSTPDRSFSPPSHFSAESSISLNMANAVPPSNLEGQQCDRTYPGACQQKKPIWQIGSDRLKLETCWLFCFPRHMTFESQAMLAASFALSTLRFVHVSFWCCILNSKEATFDR